MPWQPSRSDRGKSIALVASLHLALGALLISGLGGEPIREVSDALATFDVARPPDPPPAPPSPDESATAAEEAGAVDLAAKASPIVSPPPRVELPVETPLPTSNDAPSEVGSATSAGAGDVAGTGRGAGGEGQGAGGGGQGGSGAGGADLAIGARLLSGNLSRSDYRRIRSFGAPRGRAVLAIEVDEAGRLARCLPLEGSGVPALDFELCALLRRTRWSPATDRDGRPVRAALRYVATWDRN